MTEAQLQTITDKLDIIYNLQYTFSVTFYMIFGLLLVVIIAYWLFGRK